MDEFDESKIEVIDSLFGSAAPVSMGYIGCLGTRIHKDGLNIECAIRGIEINVWKCSETRLDVRM